MSKHTAEEVGPSKGASLVSCLAMNPDNVHASAARRARLLEAFEALPASERASLLEMAEDWCGTGHWSHEKQEARDLFSRLYRIAGLE